MSRLLVIENVLESVAELHDTVTEDDVQEVVNVLLEIDRSDIEAALEFVREEIADQ